MKPEPPVAYTSQFGQDRWLVEEIFPDKQHGFFVDAGASDGVSWNSNTLALARLGWTGICIEANPRCFPALVHNRPESMCLQCCLGSQHREVLFMDTGDGLSGVREFLAPCLEDKWSQGTPIVLPTTPLREILRSVRAPSVMDYLSIDIENSELDVLRDFPFDEFRFLAISVENQDCDELLQRQGYIRHHVLGCDSVFYWRELADHVAAIAKSREEASDGLH